MADTEYIKGDQEEPTGVGADLFIRKNKPGPTVGVGYTVDIFENGVKTQTIKAKDKKRVKEIIEEYKIKYNTARAFNNENLLHITYKTKEERGEVPTEQLTKPLQETEKEPAKEDEETPLGDLGETTPKEEFPKMPRKKQMPKMTERGETAMDSLDSTLHKKAGQIRHLLNRLIDPTIPEIRRAQTDVDTGVVDFLPQTPLPGQEDTQAEALNEDSVAKKLATKLVEYIGQHAGTPEGEEDELYNDIKRWMKDVKTNLKNWERTSGTSLDRKQLSNKIKEIVTSGNIEKIQEATGTSVDQETADLLQKITLMEIGSPPLEKGIGEEKSLAESLGKAASTTSELLEKTLNITNNVDSSNAVETAKETIKELIGDGLEQLEEMFSELPDNLSGNAVAKALNEIEKEFEEKDMKNDSKDDVKLIEFKTSDFWRYVRNMKQSKPVESAFEDWANKNKLALDQAVALWKKVSKEVGTVFYKKHAKLDVDPVASIQMLYTNDKDKLEILYEAQFKVDEVSYRSETGKIIITEPEVGIDRISAQFDHFFREDTTMTIPKEYSDKNVELKKKVGQNIVKTISRIITSEKNFGRFEALNTTAADTIRLLEGGRVVISFNVLDTPALRLSYDGAIITEEGVITEPAAGDVTEPTADTELSDFT